MASRAHARLMKGVSRVRWIFARVKAGKPLVRINPIINDGAIVFPSGKHHFCRDSFMKYHKKEQGG